MDYHAIHHLLLTFPAARLLRLRGTHAALLLSFLDCAFKAAGATSRAVAESQLTSQLTNYLRELAYLPEADELPAGADQSATSSHTPDSGLLARRYLTRWVEEGYLSLTPDEGGQLWYDLTAASEKAWQWVASLRQREFVGTHSRLRYLVEQLQALVQGSHADPTQRLRELEAERQRLDEEITRIRETGQVQTYGDLEVREKFDFIVRQSKELGGDFREVEANLRDLLLVLYQQQLQGTTSKGQALGFALEARAALQEQDEGRSFYAFWEFLTGEDQQQHLGELLEATDALLHERGLAAGPDLSFLRQLKYYLYEEARRVQQASEQLTERLHRLVTSQHPRQHRQAHAATQAIQALALQLRLIGPPPAEGLVLTGSVAAPSLPWQRPPHGAQPPTAVPPTLPAAPAARPPAGVPPAVAATLRQHRAVDLGHLRRQLATLLAGQPCLPLATVLARYPLTQGLAELVAYVALAAQQTGGRHIVDVTRSEVVPLGEDGVGLRIPYVEFRQA